MRQTVKRGNAPHNMATIVLVLALLALAGCGGGSSSSGAGGGGGVSIQHAGMYLGQGTISATLPVVGSISEPVSIKLAIDAAGTVTVDPDGDSLTGAMNGDAFAINLPASSLNEPGLACSGTLTMAGTVTGGTVNGTFSSNGAVCNGLPAQVGGGYTASKTATAALRTSVRHEKTFVGLLGGAILGAR